MSTPDPSPPCWRRATRPLRACSWRPPGSTRPSATTRTAGPAISPDVAAARAQAEHFVAASDIVKASDEDLRLALPGPDAGGDRLQPGWSSGRPLVALTRGAAGPGHPARQGRVEMAGEAITVADTVGAGDSFMAALISGLAQLEALGRGGQASACRPSPGRAARARRLRQPGRSHHLLPAGRQPAHVGRAGFPDRLPHRSGRLNALGSHLARTYCCGPHTRANAQITPSKLGFEGIICQFASRNWGLKCAFAPDATRVTGRPRLRGPDGPSDGGAQEPPGFPPCRTCRLSILSNC